MYGVPHGLDRLMGALRVIEDCENADTASSLDLHDARAARYRFIEAIDDAIAQGAFDADAITYLKGAFREHS